MASVPRAEISLKVKSAEVWAKKSSEQILIYGMDAAKTENEILEALEKEVVEISEVPVTPLRPESHRSDSIRCPKYRTLVEEVSEKKGGPLAEVAHLVPG